MQTRAVGAVHNMSSEPEAIKIVRRLGGIGPLVALLRAPSAAVCGPAAGALQNLSREAAARKEARELGAVVPLGDLLFGTDVQSQVCAAGAILNILGPELGAEVESNKQRRGLKKLLSLAITLGDAPRLAERRGGRGGGGGRSRRNAIKYRHTKRLVFSQYYSMRCTCSQRTTRWCKEKGSSRSRGSSSSSR